MTCLVPVGAASADGQHKRDYYKPCGTLEYRGEHRLFKHAYGCGPARRKARYVLKHRDAPRGWKCSLDELSNGFAACKRGDRALLLTPA